MSSSTAREATRDARDDSITFTGSVPKGYADVMRAYRNLPARERERVRHLRLRDAQHDPVLGTYVARLGHERDIETPRRAPGERRPSAPRTRRTGTPARGDPDDLDDEDEPRRCECGCGRSLEGKRSHTRFFDGSCRMKGTRQRDHADPDRVAERRLARDGADALPKHCRCDHPITYAIDHGWTCVLCGRVVAGERTAVNGHLADPAVLDVLREETRPRVSGVRLPRAWRTRPSRSQAAKLRQTRNDYIDPSIVREAVVVA